MDTDLVTRAQHGDEEAFASLAVAIGDRLHAVAHRILRDIDLAEDATQQALLAHLARPSAAPRPGALRRLVVPAPRARLLRRGTPDPPLDAERSVCSPPMSRSQADGSSPVVDRDQLERGFRRLSIDHRAVVVLHHYLDMPLDQIADDARRSRPGRSDLDFIMRCAGCARPSRPTRGRLRGRLRNEHRPRRRRASFGRGWRRASRRSRTVSWTTFSTSSPRPTQRRALVAGAEELSQ